MSSTIDRESLSITLETSSPMVHTGEPSGVSIEVRNGGTVAIWIVGVVDGSEAGARFPKWLPRVEPHALVIPAERPDFTSPLSPADFRRLEPGEAFDPTAAANGARISVNPPRRSSMRRPGACSSPVDWSAHLMKTAWVRR